MPKQITPPIVLALTLTLASTPSLAAKYYKYRSGTEQGRNWDQIDTNKDNLISPD